MLINQYTLLYESDVKMLKPVKAIECKELYIDLGDTRENIVEQIVTNLKETLNENFSLGYLAEEHLFVVAMDLEYKFLGIFEISHGTETGCSAGVKEIFTRLLMIGAERFVEFHNHPKGSVTLSEGDVESWKQLKEVAEIFGIDMLTSAVVSGNLCNYLEE